MSGASQGTERGFQLTCDGGIHLNDVALLLEDSGSLRREPRAGVLQ